jgi:CubicO group peptidase (beta-lactamase class C family)
MKTIDFETIQAAIEEQNRKQTYSGVISIFHQGKAVFNHAYGLANRSEQIPNRLNTRFGIASGGKIFTATAVGLLVQAGKLRFDQPVIEFLAEEMPNLSEKVLVRHLLSHISGVPDYFDESVMDDYEAFWLDKPVYTMVSARDFLPFMADQPMQFEPGSQFVYNNGAFVLAGLLVEKVSGQVFQKCGRKRVWPSLDAFQWLLSNRPTARAYGIRLHNRRGNLAFQYFCYSCYWSWRWGTLYECCGYESFLDDFIWQAVF